MALYKEISKRKKKVFVLFQRKKFSFYFFFYIATNFTLVFKFKKFFHQTSNIRQKFITWSILLLLLPKVNNNTYYFCEINSTIDLFI